MPVLLSALAIVIERAQEAVVRGEAPDAELKRRFIAALAQMIRDAMRAESGDPRFPKRWRFVIERLEVREYASLAARAARDRRTYDSRGRERHRSSGEAATNSAGAAT